MVTKEIREIIIEKIQKTEDELLLNEVFNLLEIDEFNSKYIFSEKQKKSISQRIDEIDNGDFLADEDASKELTQWLKK